MENNYLSEGIRTAQAGDIVRARALLAKAVQQDRLSSQAWLWLGKVLDDRDKKIFCFRSALLLDPNLLR